MPKPEESIIYRQRRKGQSVARSTVGEGGVVTPTDPAKLERDRERAARNRAKAKFAKETGYICANCGKVLSGPHAGESGGVESARTQVYKGHEYSSGLCDDCKSDEGAIGTGAGFTARDFRAQYMEYRRQREQGQT